MQSIPSIRWASRKNLFGLVYVGIALSLIANATVLTQTNVQWFQAVSNLNPSIQTLSWDLGGTIPVAVLKAYVNNPSSFGFNIQSISYQAFVNSTTMSFSVQGSTEVGSTFIPGARNILPRSNLNISTTIRINSDTVAPLKDFLSHHPNDLVTFVGVTLLIESSYITAHVPYCYQMPSQTLTICPPVRVVGGGGGGGA